MGRNHVAHLAAAGAAILIALGLAAQFKLA